MIDGNQAKSVEANASVVVVYKKKGGLIFQREDVEGGLRSMDRHFQVNKVADT